MYNIVVSKCFVQDILNFSINKDDNAMSATMTC